MLHRRLFRGWVDRIQGYEDKHRNTPEQDSEPLRRLLTLAAKHKNRQITHLILEYNRNKGEVFHNLLKYEAIETAIKSKDTEFLSFLLANSYSGGPQDSKHHINIKEIEWSLVDDFQLFKVIMKHVHQFHCSRDTIRWEKNPSLIKSIGSVCDAQEFITWIGVLADCIQDYQIRQILSSTLHQYFSLEMLENMHRTFPQVIRDVDWLSTTICSSIENYLIYLEFKAGKSDIFDSSTCFIEAAALNGNLELLQLIHSHCIDTGLPFAIGSISIGIAVEHGGCIEVVSFLLDHLDNEVKVYIVGSIHPSIQSDTLLQQLVTRPNITFSRSTLESLLLSSNFEMFKAVERLMHQRQQVMSKSDYEQLLNQRLARWPL
ncbi:hypothetical protein SAMD00019534_125320 [Acytostelium subglobosum LB1]|uniref:hypothetical protein n=1 Tax=Acytostelium subglobosum LB1 TaxID=1410327 RepID=UPI00064482CC|nr:hypothetical protein SAMD00019534_125320 [Acytostelium subglobosum LB1]GAM29356.1 hypothetical protein SAMD00019534_125320 [Acytostelium subglobosum LB1]|eukprot:XP_012747687.1 hypothetical protein SAMD00019534_125320 [Acytostelium subglobosum LB1]